ncbi:MAG: hypothetical protein D6796_07355, partial [Caldilineae bacterium]
MTADKHRWQTHLLLLLAYTVLAIALTWPTAVHFTTHLPGDGSDDPSTAWNYWWLKYSLLNEPQNPLYTDRMFYPLGLNLAFYTLAPLNGVLAMPLLLDFGVVAASNLHVGFSLVLGGYGVFLLTRWLLHTAFAADDRAARRSAALAGVFYAFASSKLFYVSLGQYTMASTHWIPFAVLFFLKMHRRPADLRWPALCALFTVMQAWSEMIYASFLVIFMGIYTLYRLLADPRRRVLRPPFLRGAFLLAMLFTVGIAPILAAMFADLRAGEDFLVVRGGFADVFSADVLGFFIPTMRHPLLGGLITRTGITAYDKTQHIYLGYTLLALASVGFIAHRRRAEARFWLAASLLFALLCLGPVIHINGVATGVPGPFVLLQHIPILKGNRYPSRYSVMLMLSLAPLAALGLTRLLRTRPAPLLAVAVAALFLFEHLSIPLPQSDMTPPPAYRAIAAEPGDFAVLDIPFAWRNGFRITGAFTPGFMFGQFYQTVHQKRLLHGNTSRNPEFKFQYFTDAPVIRTLRILETGHDLPPAAWETDRPIAPAVLRFFDIRYIVVRPEPPGYLNDPQATLPYIEAVLPVEKVREDPGLILYRVRLPSLPERVDALADSPLRSLYFGEGWGLPGETIVAQRKTARLFVPLDGEAQTLHLTVRAWPGNAPASMRVALNGWQSAAVSLSGAWQKVTVKIPAR